EPARRDLSTIRPRLTAIPDRPATPANNWAGVGARQRDSRGQEVSVGLRHGREVSHRGRPSRGTPTCAGRARGDEDALGLAASIAGLHPAGNTFPGEVFLQLAAEALDCAGVGRGNPIPCGGLLEHYLPECEFRGRQNQKIKFALLASASLRGGLEPDLLGEV